MKHVRLLLLSLAILLLPLFPGDAEAAPVKPDKAREAAQSFFSGGPSALRQSAQPRLDLVWDGESAVTRSGADPAFYVYNRTDAPGFVIISGDDRLPSLLGYSFENSFRTEGMPENIRSWFAAWREMILRVRGDAGPLPVRWDAAPRAGAVVRELKTPEWNQGVPFNNDCPRYEGRRTWAGCVPTAGAIVVRYHRWPDHVSGTVPAYTTNYLNIEVPERTLRDYDYDLMPDSYASGYSEAQSAEVARLMADLGSMCEADYRPEQTGALSGALLKGLVTYLRYDKQATLAYRENYAEPEWINLMKREIDADRPVIYGGSGEQGGHQFVLDGYNDRNLFHFNWGWGGYGNGWFYFDAPDFEYKQNQSAIIGLKKDPTGTSEYLAELALRIHEDEEGVLYLGITTTQTVFQTGEPFDVLFGSVINYSDFSFSGELKLAVCDRFGTIKEDLTQPIPVENLQLFQNMVPGAFSCTVHNPIEPGDRVRSYYRQRGGEWVMLLSSRPDLEKQEILLAEDPVDPVDPAVIAAASTFAFDRATRRITLRTMPDARVRIESQGGEVLFEATAGSEAIEADLTAFAAGEYKLTIGFEAGEPFALWIVL